MKSSFQDVLALPAVATSRRSSRRGKRGVQPPLMRGRRKESVSSSVVVVTLYMIDGEKRENKDAKLPSFLHRILESSSGMICEGKSYRGEKKKERREKRKRRH